METTDKVYLYGASGHGKVVKDIVEADNGNVVGFIDDDKGLSTFVGLPVSHEVQGISPVIVSIGNNAIRKRVVESLHCVFGTAIHPSAVVSPSAQIGEGSVVMQGAIINAGAKIGRHCIINTGASIDHECVIGDYAHIAPHATLCGQLSVGEGALVGVGASVIPCRHIGAWSVVGAGAAVVSDIPDKVVACGVPAKVQIKGAGIA